MPNAPRVIASQNALQAIERIYQRLTEQVDTLDAVVEGITMVEDDPNDHTVGYGGLPNENGVVELDASVMHGPTYRVGAVAAVPRIRHVTKLAQQVMEMTNHSLLVGDGALQFAKACGFPEEELLTEDARRIWLHWKRTRSLHDDWLTPEEQELIDPAVARWFKLSPATQTSRPQGTVHAGALNTQGQMSGATSTSGLAFSLPGRVGDTPLIGAGLYVDPEVGCCGSTGRGESALKHVVSSTVVELMRAGKSPEQAGLEVLQRMAHHTEPRLRNEQGQPKYNVTLYILSKTGEYAGVCLRGPRPFAVADSQGARLENCKYLFERS